jgi:hypothetical protein
MNRPTRSPFRSAPLAVFLATLATALVLGPATATRADPDSQAASAAAAYQPDGRIRRLCQNKYCEPVLLGNDVYNTTASGQKTTWTDYGASGEGDPTTVVFRITVQNDGTRADRFRLAASGETTGYVVKFFRGTTNITSAVMAGTYRTPSLAPGDTYLIKAKVTIVDACCGDKTARLVKIASVADPTKKDAVKFVRKFWVCGC